jgi:cohesin complex subunit SA-1/2
LPSDDLEAETNEAEDTLVCHAMSVLLTYFVWKCKECMDHIEEGTSMPDDDLTTLVERRDACITSLMTIMENRKGADDVRLEAANLLLDIYNMFRSLKVKKANLNHTPKKPQSRASRANEDDTSDDWEALAQDIDTPTVKVLMQILNAQENNLAKLTNKRLEEPDVDDDPIDPDDEPESDDEDSEDTRTQEDKQVRLLIAEERLCQYGGRIVHAYLVGSLGTEGGEAVKKRMERNKTKLTATWKEVVNHLDAQKFVKKAKKAPAKPAAKAGKSKEIVIESDEEEEEENEVPEDPIEDEEMADADAEQEEQVNGAEAKEDGAERDADEESIIGD